MLKSGNRKFALSVPEIILAAKENSGLRTQRALASHLDVTVPTVSAWVCGRSIPEWNRLRELLALAEMKLVNRDMVRIDIKRTIPIINIPPQGDPPVNYKNISHSKICVDDIMFDVDFAIKYGLDLMNPTIPQNSVVLCKKMRNIDFLDGRIVFLYLKDKKEHTVVRVYRSGKSFMLVNDNSKSVPLPTPVKNVLFLGNCVHCIIPLLE